MPNIKSAIKRVKTNNERNAQNAAVKSTMRTAIKKAEAAATNSADNAKDLVTEAVRQLDKAAQKGLIHKNAADRQKSRLMKKAN
ncbi:30S ribosomal protein S20 [Rossellomorea sp. SC111]|uniref:Small ribosomal subunit protein bS20 n=1 Tax=Rossellomorea vietnamensis TaxID=218284 RepID=A0A0P6WCH2_9BACI|nr:MULTISPECIES: 30S ribosomal protein S20 [Rossellomorea]KPL58630.1 30S ribosomal protein S20 [Rossellomorea vietnamensis]MCR8850657.1 30S ribosomal protein S20 [Rossellomorea sp. SC111]